MPEGLHVTETGKPHHTSKVFLTSKKSIPTCPAYRQTGGRFGQRTNKYNPDLLSFVILFVSSVINLFLTCEITPNVFGKESKTA